MKKYVSIKFYSKMNKLDNLLLVKDGYGGIKVFQNNQVVGQVEGYAYGCEKLNEVLSCFDTFIKVKIEVLLESSAVVKFKLPFVKRFKKLFLSLIKQNESRKLSFISVFDKFNNAKLQSFDNQKIDCHFVNLCDCGEYSLKEKNRLCFMESDALIPERIKSRIKSIDILN